MNPTNHEMQDDLAEFGVRTGWSGNGRLMQDDSRDLSRSLSQDPAARLHVREVCEVITSEGYRRICTGPCNQGRTTCPCPESCEVPSEEHEGFGAVVWPLFAFVVSAFLVTVALGLARLFA